MNTKKTKAMTNNKQQTAVEWLFGQIPGACKSSKGAHDALEQAKEMEIAGKEMSYDDGYAEGYKRAYELMEWCMKNYIKTREKDI
jgi:hypothetical protein